MIAAAALLVVGLGAVGYSSSQGQLGALLASLQRPAQVPPAKPAEAAPGADVIAATAQAVLPIEPLPAPPQPAAPEAAVPTRAATTTTTATPGPATAVEKPDAEAATPGAPSKAQACYTRANRLLNTKKVNVAVRELNKCLDLDANYGRVYRSLGVGYMLLGRERAAILAYEKFVDLEPQHKDVAKVREIIADYYRRRRN
jgi:tetratricopeptide (TPR) repeat protein